MQSGLAGSAKPLRGQNLQQRTTTRFAPLYVQVNRVRFQSFPERIPFILFPSIVSVRMTLYRNSLRFTSVKVTVSPFFSSFSRPKCPS